MKMNEMEYSIVIILMMIILSSTKAFLRRFFSRACMRGGCDYIQFGE